MTEGTFDRAAVRELRAEAVKWAARADEAADAKHFRDAQQHLRRANELAYSAHKLEQTLTNA